jgi:thiamine biosynthesis protein ThiS
MMVEVNGDPTELAEGITIGGLIAALGLDRGPVAVERNGVVVVRAEHPTTVLAEGDRIEIVHFVGGG